MHVFLSQLIQQGYSQSDRTGKNLFEGLERLLLIETIVKLQCFGRSCPVLTIKGRCVTNRWKLIQMVLHPQNASYLIFTENLWQHFLRWGRLTADAGPTRIPHRRSTTLDGTCLPNLRCENCKPLLGNKISAKSGNFWLQKKASSHCLE